MSVHGMNAYPGNGRSTPRESLDPIHLEHSRHGEPDGIYPRYPPKIRSPLLSVLVHDTSKAPEKPQVPWLAHAGNTLARRAVLHQPRRHHAPRHPPAIAGEMRSSIE
jgi:hypothetical protein